MTSSVSSFSPNGSISEQPAVGDVGGGGGASDASLLWATPYVVSSDADAPYRSIQAALTAIENDLPDEAIVLIEAGDYNESLVFTSFGDVEIKLTPLGSSSAGVGVRVLGSFTIAGSGSGVTQVTLDNVSFATSGTDGLTVTQDGPVVVQLVGGTISSDQNAVVINDTSPVGGAPSLFRSAANARISSSGGRALDVDGARVDCRETVISATDPTARLLFAQSTTVPCELAFAACTFQPGADSVDVPIFDLGAGTVMAVAGKHPEEPTTLSCGNRTVFFYRDLAQVRITDGAIFDTAPSASDSNAFANITGAFSPGTSLVAIDSSLRTQDEILVDVVGNLFGGVLVELYNCEIRAGAIGGVAPYGLSNSGGAPNLNLYFDNLRFANTSSTDLTYLSPDWGALPRTNTPVAKP